jgi:hypothetical protein
VAPDARLLAAAHIAGALTSSPYFLERVSGQTHADRFAAAVAVAARMVRDLEKALNP